jgi:hypothetical protein
MPPIELITGIRGGDIAVVLLTTAFDNYNKKIEENAAMLAGKGALSQDVQPHPGEWPPTSTG